MGRQAGATANSGQNERFIMIGDRRKSKKEYKTKKNCVRIGFVKKARLKRHSFLLLRRAK